MTELVLRAFLFTDLVGSTVWWDTDATTMSAALFRHDAVANGAVADAGGVVFKHTGDGLCASFGSPADAVAAAVAIQRVFLADEVLSVRMGVHVGSAEPRGGDWFGAEVNRAARVMGVAHGGQILVSGPAAGLMASRVDGVEVERVGLVRLRGIADLEEVHQVVAEGLVSDFPPVAGQAIDTLPQPRTSFLGRDREIDEVRRLVDEHRLVTLAGVGGTGKTRLAIEAAGGVVDRFPGGVMFGALADVGDVDGLVDALCGASGVSGAGFGGHADDRRDALVRALSARHGLLVVDNCEHLLDPVADLVDEIVERCPQMRIVATSREPLGVAGEHVVRVGALSDDAAVELLAGRARSAGPGSEWSDTDRALAVDLCRRLDGLPLAIELAAARLRVMSLTEVTSRLDDRFRLLAGRGRTHDRHATLRATLDWSFGLLDEHEQVLLARLSVFAGGFELDAAEAVCGVDPLDPDDMVDLVTSLVDKSLVGVAADGAVARYSMLETVRAYAADHLAERGETETLIERHADWVAQLAATTWLAAGDPGALSHAVDRLRRDVDNARAAHTWAVDTNHPDTALAVAAALARSWLTTGGAVEGLRRCEEALELDGGEPLYRILCTLMGSYVARWAGDHDRASRYALDALAQNGADMLIPSVEVWKNLAAVKALATREVGPSFEECVAQVRAAGREAEANHEEGIYCLRTGHPARAVAFFERSGGAYGDHFDLYLPCWVAAARLEAEGDAQISSALIDRIEVSGDRQLLMLALFVAARIAAHRNAPFGELVQVAVDTARAIGFRADYTAESFAAVAVEAHKPHEAALLLGRGQEMTAFLSPEILRDNVRGAIGDSEYDRLLAEGAQLTDDELFALALGLDDR